MRATELLGCHVYDADGERLGTVHDLSFELTWSRDGRATCRLTGLECGDFATLGHRFGYGRGDMAGPWPLKSLLTRRRERGPLEIEWSDVAAFDAPRIDLKRTRRELERPGGRR